MIAALAAWFATNKLKVFEIGALIVMVAAIFFAIWLNEHNKSAMAEKIGRQEAQIAIQAAKIEQLEKNAARLREDAEQLTKNSQVLFDNLTAIRDQANKTQQDLAKHDLQAIGSKKPNLLTPRVNKAMQEYFKRIEEQTR